MATVCPRAKGVRWRPESVHGNAKASLLYEAIECVDSPCFDMPCKAFSTVGLCTEQGTIEGWP